MVISLDSYRTQKAAAQTWLKNGTYGAEIMHTDWNAPVVHVLRDAVSAVPSPELPVHLADGEVDHLLNRVYGVASLI